MRLYEDLGRPGIVAALGAALLFGAGTPLAKALLVDVNPWLMAGLLYLGSGLGLTAYRLIRRAPRAQLEPAELPWLVGAIAAGGLAAPVLLMYGLTRMPASGASLLLNAEGVFTALIAWFAFRENFDRRIALGMAAIVAGAGVMSWPGELRFGATWPALAVLGACLGWAVDNNLTRRVSLSDATWIAAVKGLCAGVANLLLALVINSSMPAPGGVVAALLIGCLSYGVSLAFFVVALRHLGAARTGAYFSVAPFFGAAVAVTFFHEPVTARLLIAGVLMALGVWLHVTERHSHLHTHQPIEHEHEHEHDAHHQHAHERWVPAGARHTHRHRHEPLTHNHPHFPDAHHRHKR
ncbi:MAG TPA: DMT family transporter [Steroidobacteraceae bacterium]|nr:DMT family transporter [Steroidobacteraceae bacterium]